MADDLKDVNKALQEANLAAEKSRQETNKNLQIVAENQKHDNAPRERILDALPEIIDQEKIAKREKLQRNALQKQDEEAEEQASEKARKVWVEGGTLDNAGELVIPEATAAQLLQWNADMIDAFIEATAENKKIDMNRSAVLLKTQQALLQGSRKWWSFGVKTGPRWKKIDKISDQITAAEKIANDIKVAIEDQGGDAAKSVEYQKQLLEIEKLKSKRDAAFGSADSEDKAKEKANSFRQASLLGKISKGITGIWGTAKKTAKAVFPSWKSLLVGGLAAAALVFLNHPKFKEMVEVIKKKIIPALTTVIDDYLIPIGKMLWDNLVKAGKEIWKLFSGIGEAMDLFSEGDSWGGVKKIIETIWNFFKNMIDLGLTSLWNIISKVFGLDLETNSILGSLVKSFKKMIGISDDDEDMSLEDKKEELSSLEKRKKASESDANVEGVGFLTAEEEKRILALTKDIKEKENDPDYIKKEAAKALEVKQDEDKAAKLFKTGDALGYGSMAGKYSSVAIKQREKELAAAKREKESGYNRNMGQILVGGDTNIAPEKRTINIPINIGNINPVSEKLASAN